MPPAPAGPYQSLENDVARRESLPRVAPDQTILSPDNFNETADKLLKGGDCEGNPRQYGGHANRQSGPVQRNWWDWGVPAVQSPPGYGSSGLPQMQYVPYTQRPKQHCGPYGRL